MRCTTLKASAGDIDGLLIYYALIHSPVDLTIAQVATDSATATLGIVNLVPGERGVPRSAIDQAVRSHVAGHHKLEAFSTFWDADDAVLFAPPRGCSPPTFRGSSADAMAIASTAISLIGPTAAAKLQGGLPMAGSSSIQVTNRRSRRRNPPLSGGFRSERTTGFEPATLTLAR